MSDVNQLPPYHPPPYLPPSIAVPRSGGGRKGAIFCLVHPSQNKRAFVFFSILFFTPSQPTTLTIDLLRSLFLSSFPSASLSLCLSLSLSVCLSLCISFPVSLSHPRFPSFRVHQRTTNRKGRLGMRGTGSPPQHLHHPHFLLLPNRRDIWCESRRERRLISKQPLFSQMLLQRCIINSSSSYRRFQINETYP